MSKEIELHIKISNTGKLIVTPKGTQGKECLDILSFIDKISGVKNIETEANEDMKMSNNKINDFEINKLK